MWYPDCVYLARFHADPWLTSVAALFRSDAWMSTIVRCCTISAIEKHFRHSRFDFDLIKWYVSEFGGFPFFYQNRFFFSSMMWKMQKMQKKMLSSSFEAKKKLQSRFWHQSFSLKKNQSIAESILMPLWVYAAYDFVREWAACQAN